MASESTLLSCQGGYIQPNLELKMMIKKHVFTIKLWQAVQDMLFPITPTRDEIFSCFYSIPIPDQKTGSCAFSNFKNPGYCVFSACLIQLFIKIPDSMTQLFIHVKHNWQILRGMLNVESWMAARLFFTIILVILGHRDCGPQICVNFSFKDTSYH